MVEIFRTNILEKDVAEKIVQKLLEQFPCIVINFDLEDCDKILRVKGDEIDPKQIVLVLKGEGYFCEILE